MNSLLVEYEDILRWNWADEKKNGKHNLNVAEVLRGTKDDGEVIEIPLQLTDHVQLNFYVARRTLHEVRPTPIEPVVLAFHIRYNK